MLVVQHPLLSCGVGRDSEGDEEWALRVAEEEVSQGARSQAVDAYVSQRQEGSDKGQQPLNGEADVALQALKLLDSAAQPKSQ
jgi:hypothetical protein